MMTLVLVPVVCKIDSKQRIGEFKELHNRVNTPYMCSCATDDTFSQPQVYQVASMQLHSLLPEVHVASASDIGKTISTSTFVMYH